MEEIWKDILGYEDYYQVSNLGNIKSKDRNIVRNDFTYLRKGKIFRKSIDSLGYEVVGLTINSKTINYKVHRLVAINFIPNLDNKLYINHIDGIKNNNWINNLEWCTSSENSLHAYKMGLRKAPIYDKSKENSNSAKLTEIKVSEIRNKYIPYKYSTKQLVEEYNVSESCISHIIKNRSWKNNVK